MSVFFVNKTFNILNLLAMYIFGKRIDPYRNRLDPSFPGRLLNPGLRLFGNGLTLPRFKARNLFMNSTQNRFRFFSFFSFRFFRSACGLGVCV